MAQRAQLMRVVQWGLWAWWASSVAACNDCPSRPPSVKYVEVANPVQNGMPADAGVPGATITADAYQQCAETLDCTKLCKQVEYVSPGDSVNECVRVATDASASGDERLALRITYTYLCE